MARTASEAIAEKIRAAIATGEVKPGEMLPSETALLERYDVARSTMREALRILESDGLLTIERGIKGGARVQEPNIASLARRVGLHLQLRGATMRDLIAVQAAIQPRAAAVAAAARTDDDLDGLRAAVDAVEASADMDAYLAAFGRFVRLLLRASHNAVMALLTDLTSELWTTGLDAFLDEIDAPARFSAELHRTSVQVARELVERIADGDGDGAEAVWRIWLEDTGVIRRESAAPLLVYADKNRS